MNTKKCPECGAAVVTDAGNPWRPFCSERCRLIDLGEWLSGSRAIPGPEAPADLSAPDQETLH
jgi:uncharacterized protein